MDVGSQNAYPSCSLSNFAAHEFVIDGVKCASMEGFLQSLKFANPDMQVHICSLIGIAAKRAGSEKDWKKHQTLYWRGQKIGRRTKEYQDLLDRAYLALFQNEGFRNALRAGGRDRPHHPRVLPPSQVAQGHASLEGRSIGIGETP